MGLPDYRRIHLRQHGGRDRVVFAPREDLLLQQRRALTEMRAAAARVGVRPSLWSHSQRGRSNISHAREHAGQALLITMDLQDFFGHVTTEMARATPLEVPDICFLEGVLPPGAPTSPFLADLAVAPLDAKLAKLGARYSRYVDDLAFSWSRRPAHVRAFVKEVEACCEAAGFPVNCRKTLVMPRCVRQVICGLVTNLSRGAPVRAPRKTWQQLRAAVNNLEADVWHLWSSKGIEWTKQFDQAKALVHHLAYCEPKKAEPYIERLKALDAWRDMR